MLRRSLVIASAKDAFDYCVSRTNPGVGRSHNLMLDHGKGSYVFDADGKKYLDFACGIGVTNLGHSHPRLIEAVKTQVDKAWHLQVCTGPHTALQKLIQKLETIFPAPLSNFSFVTTGAEAVEAAMKLSRAARPGRPNCAVLQGGYHGRTVGAASLTTSKFGYARGLRPLMPGVTVLPVPYTSQMALAPSADVERMIDQALEQVECLLFQTTHPEEVSMLIAEPTLGEGGYVPLPRRYYQGLRNLCTKHGMLLCIDEVQSGFGRTGTMFNFEQLVSRDASGGFVESELPDVVIFAKGIANGMPIAGMVTRNELAAQQVPGQQGGTYAANPIACASASEVVSIMTENGFLDNVNARAMQLRAALQDAVSKNGMPVMEIRGRGLMLGLQFDGSCPVGTATQVANKACEAGLIILPTSKFETIRLIPPLNVSEAEVTEGADILAKAMIDVTANMPKKQGAFRPCCAEGSQCYSALGPCRDIYE